MATHQKVKPDNQCNHEWTKKDKHYQCNHCKGTKKFILEIKTSLWNEKTQKEWRDKVEWSRIQYSIPTIILTVVGLSQKSTFLTGVGLFYFTSLILTITTRKKWERQHTINKSKPETKYNGKINDTRTGKEIK